jgi:hypothetical protein
VEQAILERIEEAKIRIVFSNDPAFDARTKGMIQAYYEVLDIRVHEEETIDEV